MTTAAPFAPYVAAMLLMIAASSSHPAFAIDDEEDWEPLLRGSQAAPDLIGTPLTGMDEVPSEEQPEPVRSAPPDDDPFAPLGIRIGAFMLFPSLELRAGYSDNIGQVDHDPVAAGYARIMPGFEFISDWSRHELRGRAVASYRKPVSGDQPTDTRLDGELVGRIDLRTGLHAGLGLSYAREPESHNDPNVPPGSDRVEVERLRAESSLTREIGRTRLSMRGAMQWTDYDEDPLLSEHGPRSYRTSEAGARASYELVEGTALFVDAAANRRHYRRAPAAVAPRRGSRGYEVLAGLEMRLTGLMTGEAGIGYQRQTPDDPDLPVIQGPAFRAALTWEPSALTKVMLSGSLSAEEASIDPLASGARVATAELIVSHSFRRNLIGSVALGHTRSNYVGSPRRESTWRAGLGLEYLLSRELAIVAEAAHERHMSTLPGDNFTENRIEVGLRMRR